jgi:O-antigen/teichoic acid export membrane protein
MDRIYWNTGQFVLGVTSGTIAVSVFAVAIQLEGMYMMFSVAISGVFLPRVTSMVTKNDNTKEISDLFIRTGRIQYIILSFILSGFIVFGQQFIVFWAGPAYKDAYIMSIMFFVSLTVPLIQNLGITILQARNQMKFRSLLYLFTSVGSLAIQIPLAQLFGGIGCAVAISVALIIGQVIVMNFYYYKVQMLNILSFWKEILKMSAVPLLLTMFSLFVISKFEFNNLTAFIVGIIIFSILYLTLFWKFSMNSYERELFYKPIMKLVG